MKTLTIIFYIKRIFKSNLHIDKRFISRKIIRESEKSVTKVPRQKIKTSKEVENYLSSSDHLLKIKYELPIRFLRRNNKVPDDLYLVDCNVGKEISAALKPYILSRNNTIIETNPGFGFITRDLLEGGLKDIHLYETVVSFRKYALQDLNKEYPTQLKMYNRDFFSIWKLSYQDRYDNGDRVKKLLSNIQIKQWNDDLVMSIIGTTATTNFIRHLMLSLIFQFGIMTFGRCELYLVQPPSLYLQLTATPGVSYLLYRASSVLFQLLFDFEILLKVPRKAFLPWDNSILHKSRKKLWRLFSTDSEYMYLTRIEFKKELPVPLDKIQHLWYFIHHLMLSRNGKLIPLLEKWIPGCGVRLIVNNSKLSPDDEKCIYPNLDIFVECGQLNAQQYLKLFKEFSSWPEYSQSSFLASMEGALLKMETVQNIDDHNQEIEEQEEKRDSDNIIVEN